MNLRRRIREMVAAKSMLAATLFSGLLVVSMAITLYLRSRPLLQTHSIWRVISGNKWMPSAGEFGMLPFIMGTLWVTVVAVVLAVPVCILAAIFLSEYANTRVRTLIRPLVDLLAGVPSVVFGLWAVLVVVPLIGKVAAPFAQRHLSNIPFLASNYSSGFGVLAGAVVLAVMVSPIIISVAEGVLGAVPVEYREASCALGATKLETTCRVVVKKSLPGLVAAVVFGVSRALGETMAVLMVVGNVALSPKSIFDAAYPLPALIANNYGEMMSVPLYDSALLFSALILLIIVVFFNIVAQFVLARSVRKKL